MEKIKIYKSSKEIEFQTFNDYNSSKSNLSEHIYVYLYIKSNDYKNQRDGYGGGYDKDYINSAYLDLEVNSTIWREMKKK